MTKSIIAFFVFIALFLSNAWADPVVVIVNKKNPTTSLSASDVQKYFLNKAKSWPSGEKVKPINRNDKSSVKKDFVLSTLGMSLQDYQQYWMGVKQRSGETEPKVVKSNKFVLKIVGKSKVAIGYLPASYFEKLDNKSKEKVKVVLKQ
jgi:ABC-type phosphate transport system substrate-binding protein